ncbi:MAG: pyridoxal phosphate-dependent aminotransferase [Acidobacteriota bacterium]|nr:MAG: pyridoxal phosphate-dependent aminotransferase [Acidobacteriota bacterium]
MKTSIYMTWAKHHAGARYNLANSGMLGCDPGDLTLTMDDVALNGPNHEGYAPLKEAIAARYGVSADNVVPAQGTSMANFLAMATALDPGDEVLIEQPTYEPLLASARWLGAVVRRFPRRFEDGWRIDPDEVIREITPRTKLIVITSPHNPSGVVVEPGTMRRIIEAAAESGAMVLVDEVYRDILFEDVTPVNARLGAHVMTTASLTKSYGLSGLRCGWILCHPDFAERARRMNDLFGAVGSAPSDTLSVAAFRQVDRLEVRSRALLEANSRLVKEFLAGHEKFLECVVPSRSMIVFPRLRSGRESDALHDHLRRYETSIVPGRFFESPRHFRLGYVVRTEDVETGLANLSRSLRELS